MKTKEATAASLNPIMSLSHGKVILTQLIILIYENLDLGHSRAIKQKEFLELVVTRLLRNYVPWKMRRFIKIQSVHAWRIASKHIGMVGRRKKTSQLHVTNCSTWGSIMFSYILLLRVHHQNTIMQAKFCSEVIITDFKRCCVDIQHVRSGFDPITSGNLYDCICNEGTASVF